MNKRTDGSKQRPLTPNVNDSELSRESWKIFQVISEFVEGYERLFQIRPSVSVFGSSRAKPDSEFYQFAQTMAELLSNSGYSVVTGGGRGIMEASNKGAYQGSAFSVGLNIVLPDEIPNTDYQDISLRFRHFFTRKVMFVKYTAAYIVIPGGYGTLDELTEILSLIQTKKTRRIPVIIVQKNYWQPLIDWFENTLLKHGMIDAHDMTLYSFAETPEDVLAIIQKFYKK